MWVFGYGSLMNDGWEKGYGSTFRGVADLHGYRRVFSKASVANWGTRLSPCPTLNLEAHAGALCVGIAFEFPDDRADAVTAYLVKREGKSFTFPQLKIAVKDRGETHALVPLYFGRNIYPTMPAEELVVAIRKASGTSGMCADYVLNVHKDLTAAGIDDPAVTQLNELLSARCS